MSQPSQKTLVRALYKVLRPMVRVLLRHGLSYRQFAEVARHVFVDVAEEDFALPGRKPSKARTAVLTGINRKDIAKLKERPHPLSDSANESPTPAARLIYGWINDPAFQQSDGRPAELALEESEPGGTCFATLARQYTNDVPLRALLDELTRIGAVAVDGDKVRLLVTAYIPHQDMEENIRIFGTAAADLINTIDHNLAGAPPGPFIQRTVSYDRIPPELLAMIRQRSMAEGEAFLLQVNDWLAKCETQPSTDSGKTTHARAGLGLYYFEHLTDTDQKERSK